MTNIHQNSTFLGYLTKNGTSNKKKTTTYKCDPLKFPPKIFENHKNVFFNYIIILFFSILWWTIFLISIIINNDRNITFTTIFTPIQIKLSINYSLGSIYCYIRFICLNRGHSRCTVFGHNFKFSWPPFFY